MRGKGSYAKYGKDKLQEAIEAVKNGMPLSQSSRYTGVNKKDLKLTEKLFLVQQLLLKIFNFGAKKFYFTFTIYLHFKAVIVFNISLEIGRI